MIAEIISVGTELLMGEVTNTDARFVSEMLRELSIDMYHQSVVGDNFERLSASLELASSRADIIITTGGLGPTADDMTKECVAAFCGVDLEFREEIFAGIEKRFAARGIEITPNNKKQANFPKDATILKNPNGTAPGCIIESKGKWFIVLPGPPKELKPMLRDSVAPFLEKFTDGVLYAINVQVFGLGESSVEYALNDLINSTTDVTIATYCHPGYVTVRVAAKAEDEALAKSRLNPIVEKIQELLKDNIFEIGNRNLSEVVCDYLIDNNISISVSESCSGGLVSDALVQVSGISSIYKLGVTSYSNEAKMNVLGVEKDTLDTVGAVSKETAIQMAQGVRRLGNTDIGISTTGIAGPNSDNTKKPVGLVYIALATEKETIYEELRLGGSRQDIRTMTVLHVFNMIRKYYMGKGERYGG